MIADIKVLLECTIDNAGTGNLANEEADLEIEFDFTP